MSLIIRDAGYPPVPNLWEDTPEVLEWLEQKRKEHEEEKKLIKEMKDILTEIKNES